MFRETQWRDVLQNNWPVVFKNVQTNAVCDHNWIQTYKPITGKMGEMQKKSVDQKASPFHGCTMMIWGKALIFSEEILEYKGVMCINSAV